MDSIGCLPDFFSVIFDILLTNCVLVAAVRSTKVLTHIGQALSSFLGWHQELL